MSPPSWTYLPPHPTPLSCRRASGELPVLYRPIICLLYTWWCIFQGFSLHLPHLLLPPGFAFLTSFQTMLMLPVWNTPWEPLVWSVGGMGRPFWIRVEVNLVCTERRTRPGRNWKWRGDRRSLGACGARWEEPLCWAEFDDRRWRAGEHPGFWRRAVWLQGPCPVVLLMRGPGSKRTARSPAWPQCERTSGAELGASWSLPGGGCRPSLRCARLPRADASPEDLVGTQVLIHVVWDTDAAGRWTTLWKAGGWSTNLRRILRAYVSEAGMSAVGGDVCIAFGPGVYFSGCRPSCLLVVRRLQQEGLCSALAGVGGRRSLSPAPHICTSHGAQSSVLSPGLILCWADL